MEWLWIASAVVWIVSCVILALCLMVLRKVLDK